MAMRWASPRERRDGQSSVVVERKEEEEEGEEEEEEEEGEEEEEEEEGRRWASPTAWRVRRARSSAIPSSSSWEG